MRLVTEATSNLLLRSKFTKKRTEIPNSHKLLTLPVDKEGTTDIQRLTRYAQALGIDIQDTGFTYSVASTDNGYQVYGASIMADNGEATIFWGNLKTTLKAVPDTTEKTLQVSESKQFFIEFYTVIDDVDVSFELPLVVNKKLTPKPEIGDLRTGLRKGTLGTYLSSGFTKAKKLDELEPGEYVMTGYGIRYFNGDPKAEVYLTVDGKRRVYSANTYLKNRLLASPEIDEHTPAILQVGIITKKTATGYNIVPTTLTTKEDEDIPVYDFGETDATPSKTAEEEEFIMPENLKSYPFTDEESLDYPPY